MWLFFFSSRRRHTRFKCDWSSDVCSSDLLFVAARVNLHGTSPWHHEKHARITRAMFVAPYSLDEVKFAYCNRIFLRWRTHRNRPFPVLAELDQCTLSEIAARYGLEIVESASSQNELMAQVSMKPDESISA